MSQLKQMFGRRVRQLRQRADWSQEELAERIGRSTEFISNLERGVNGPSFQTIEDLSLTFNVTVKELFDFDQPEEAH